MKIIGSILVCLFTAVLCILVAALLTAKGV